MKKLFVLIFSLCTLASAQTVVNESSDPFILYPTLTAVSVIAALVYLAKYLDTRAENKQKEVNEGHKAKHDENAAKIELQGAKIESMDKYIQGELKDQLSSTVKALERNNVLFEEILITLKK